MVLAKLLDGSALSPLLASVIGCMFGLLVFVVMNSQAELDPKVHWIIAGVVALLTGGGINLFLKPNVHISSSHD